MIDNNIDKDQEIMRLKAQVAALEQLLEVHEQTTLEQSDRLEQTLQALTKRAAELEDAKNFVDSVFENLPTMLFVKEAEELRFVHWNKAGEELTGFTREEFMGKNDYDFFPKEEADFFTVKDREVLNEGKLLDIPEEPIQTKHRGTRLLHTRKIPVYGSDGKPKYLLGLSEDITARKQTEETILKRARELETVARVGTVTSTILEIDKLLQEVVDLTKSSFNLYHAHVYLLNQVGDTLILAAGAGEVGRQMVNQGWSIPLEREHSLVARAARTRQGIIVNDVRKEPDFLPNPLLPETRAEMAVPLIVGGQVLGVLDVQADVVDRFTQEDVRLKTILAGQIAVALQNARSFSEQQQAQFMLSERVNELNCLNDIGREIAETPPVAELLRWVAARIPPAMRYRALCMAAIEYEDQIYGKPEAITLPCQIVHALRIRGEVAGRVYIAYTEKREFLDEESALIGGIASRLSGYIESRRLVEQTREAQAESALLYATANQLIQAADPTELLEAASAYARSLGANAGQLLYFDSDPQGRPEWAETIAQWQSAGGGMPLATRFYLPDFAMTKLWISQPDQPLLIGETISSELIDPVVRELLVQSQTHALALMPLNIQGRWVGLVTFSWNKPYSFTERDGRILTTIAQQTATVVDAARASQQTQAALAENQQQKEFLSKIINFLPVGLFAKDVKDDFRFSIWNAKMEEMFGVKTEEMLGKNDYEYSEKEQADFYRKIDIAAIEGRQVIDIPVEEITTAQGIRLAHTTKLPIFDSEGKPETLLVVLEDITERKQSEEALQASEARQQALLNAIPDLIMRLSGDGIYLDIKPARDFPTIVPPEELIGKNSFEVLPLELAQQRQTYIEQALTTGETQLYEHKLERNDRTAYEEIRVIPSGENEVLMIIRDISERKQADVEREQLLAEVEATYRQYVRREWAQFLGEQQSGWRIEHQAQPVELSAEMLDQLQAEVIHGGKTKVIAGAKDNGHIAEPIMVAPIALRGQVIGTLSLQDNASERKWTDEEMALVQTVSEQLALTVENLRLFDDTQKQATREQLTRQITDKMRAEPDIDSIIQTGLDELAKALNVSRAYVKLSTKSDHD